MDKIEQKIINQDIKEWDIEDLKSLAKEKSEPRYPYKDTTTENLENENWEKEYPFLQNILNMYNPKHYIGVRYHSIDKMYVSNLGRVKVSYTDGTTEVLAQDDRIEEGYLMLSKFPGFGKVYRLVADTWLTKTENRNIVHHIDNDGYNNKVENLIWVSAEEHAKIHN